MTAFGLGKSADGELRYGASADSGYQQFIGRLVEFIPGDVVAGYVVVLGFLPESSSRGPIWLTAAVFAILAPLIVLLTAEAIGHQAIFRAGAAVVAFAVWVLALPGSPVVHVEDWLRSLILIATTIVLTLVDKRLDAGT